MQISGITFEDKVYRLAMDFEMDLTAEESLLVTTLCHHAGEVIELLIRKRRDYGSANIGLTGLAGLAVRLVDKSCRVWNLATAPVGSAPAVNEKVEETLEDILGYSLMALMVEGGEGW